MMPWRPLSMSDTVLGGHRPGPAVLSTASCFLLENARFIKAISKYGLVESWFSHRQNLIASRQARFEPWAPDLKSTKAHAGPVGSQRQEPPLAVPQKAAHPTARHTQYPTARHTFQPPLERCPGAPVRRVRVTLAVPAVHVLIQRGMILQRQLAKLPGANYDISDLNCTLGMQ